MQVESNAADANELPAGDGMDWFWEMYAWDLVNRKTADLLD